MIIGISGVAGTGKDTVASILVDNHLFVRIALADVIKRIVRDVFDFSESQLWGPSEKRNEIDYRYPRNLDRLPAEARKAYERLRLVDDVAKAEFAKLGIEFLTPRYALQTSATNWARNCYPDIWVEYTLRIVKQLLKRDYNYGDYIFRYSPQMGLYNDVMFIYSDKLNKLPAGVVISDVRFLNEFNAIKKMGGKMWRLTRLDAGLSGDAGQHVSETEQAIIPDSEFNAIVTNDGTVEELAKKIADLLGHQ